MSPSRRLRYGLEAAGFFLVIGFFRLFGPNRASAIGGWIGRHLGAAGGGSKRARENLRAAFPEKSEAETATILTGMWDNLGRVMAEYAHLTHLDPQIELVGLEHAEAARAQGKGVLVLSAHLANWEIMPIAGKQFGFAGGTVVRPPNNPYVARWIEKQRVLSSRFEQIPKGAGGTKRVFSLLRKGGAVLMLIDQRASEGILVPFFGRDAFTTPAPAALALKLRSPILLATNERIGGARFRVTLHPPILAEATGDHEHDVVALTAALTQFVERAVRARPEQWLWIHKRWTAAGAPLRKRAAQTLSPGRGGTSNATSNRV